MHPNTYEPVLVEYWYFSWFRLRDRSATRARPSAASAALGNLQESTGMPRFLYHCEAPLPGRRSVATRVPKEFLRLPRNDTGKHIRSKFILSIANFRIRVTIPCAGRLRHSP